MLKQLTYESWFLYLDINRLLNEISQDLPIECSLKIQQIVDQAYHRYERCRDAWISSGYR